MLCAGVYDHVLLNLDSEHTFISRPRVLAKTLAKQYLTRRVDIEKIMRERSFPFDSTIADMLFSICDNRGKIPSSLRYSSFDLFMLYVTGWEYFPTKPLEECIALKMPDASDKEVIATQVPSASVNSIKKVGNKIFTFVLDSGERVFFHNRGIPMVYPLRTVLRYLHFALKWAKSVQGNHLPFVVSSLPPPRGFGSELAFRVTEAYNAKDSWTYLWKILVTEVLPHLDKFNGIIATVYSAERFSDVSSDGGNPCIICLSGMSDATEVLTLRCGHAFHTECIRAHERVRSTCPICRSPMT